MFFFAFAVQAKTVKFDRDYGQQYQVPLGMEIKMELPDDAQVIPPNLSESQVLLAQIKFKIPDGEEILFLEPKRVSLGKEVSRSKELEKHIADLAKNLGVTDESRPHVIAPFNSSAGGGWILSGTNASKTVRISIVGILNPASVHCLVGVVRHPSAHPALVGASPALESLQKILFGKEYL